MTPEDVVRQALDELEIPYESPKPGTVVAVLPGDHKLKTAASLVLGAHSLSLNAFVVRAPEENHQQVYRWLLERNLRGHGVGYALDSLGDVYIVAQLPLAAVSVETIDALMGAVLEASDGAFDTLLMLGFASSIRREHAWRVSRGESTANLAAFSQLIERPEESR